MIFPLCEKLGQTIIFVRTRETARALHAAVSQRLASPGHPGMLQAQAPCCPVCTPLLAKGVSAGCWTTCARLFTPEA